ncbi:MAG: Tll0287-like domain-containing protein [Stellaceae bacterium]
MSFRGKSGTLWRVPVLLAAAILAAAVLAVAAIPSFAVAEQATPTGDAATAQSLAEMLRDARTVISNNEDLINNPAIGDKHLSGSRVLNDAIQLYKKATGVEPTAIDPNSYQGRLMRALMAAIVQVTDENQVTINEKGMGFKGFIPAVFGRLVSEAFNGLAKGEAVMKVTAPPDLVRNRKALPDPWETEVIETKLLSPQWPRGQPYSAMVETDGRQAYRFAVPEYYTASCLACHGTPKGALDITGYPKEGRKLGDLGGVMSITLFR